MLIQSSHFPSLQNIQHFLDELFNCQLIYIPHTIYATPLCLQLGLPVVVKQF